MNWNPWLWRQKAFFCAGHLPIFAMTDEKEPSNTHTPEHAGTLEGYQSWSLDPRPLAWPQKFCCGDENR